MKQQSIYETLKKRAPQVVDVQDLEVYDFFCGGGGFGEGARQAGCRLVWACDSCAMALEVHAANHPGCVRLQATLPLPRAQWPFPNDGRAFHVHFSPPCTQFSNINAKSCTNDARRRATNLVRWSLKTALVSGATSWSLEQVATQEVVALVEAARKQHPMRVAYARFDFLELGVPQTRTRLLAGTPELIARLMRLRALSNRRVVRNIIAQPRGTHIRNSKAWKYRKSNLNGVYEYTKADWTDNCHSVDKPSPTVLADRGLTWVTITKPGYKTTRLDTREIAALQTFPPEYQLPPIAKHAMRVIGNAVPPLVARLLMGGK